MTNPSQPQPSTAALVKKLRSFIPDASFASDALDELASAIVAADERERELQRDSDERLRTANEAITRMHAAESALAARTAEREVLREALSKYGEHLAGCSHSEYPHSRIKCSCGLDAALAASTDAPEPPCSNCGCDERDHRGTLTCRCPAPAPQRTDSDAKCEVCGTAVKRPYVRCTQHLQGGCW